MLMALHTPYTTGLVPETGFCTIATTVRAATRPICTTEPHRIMLGTARTEAGGHGPETVKHADFLLTNKRQICERQKRKVCRFGLWQLSTGCMTRLFIGP